MILWNWTVGVVLGRKWCDPMCDHAGLVLSVTMFDPELPGLIAPFAGAAKLP